MPNDLIKDPKKKIAILCINIGTPSDPSPKSVRKYLKEFLSDPRVVDIPWLSRKLLLYLFILPFRPKKSAEAYEKIWTKEGSPLLLETQKFCHGLQKGLGDSYKVIPAMRYGEPSLNHALVSVNNYNKVILFPLFPQYASSSTGSCLEYSLNFFAKQNNIPSLEIIAPFYKKDFFISALTSSLKESVDLKNWDHLLMSYHGLPQRQIQKSEENPENMCLQEKPCILKEADHFCYRGQCYETSRLLANSLGLKSSEYTVSFQSRLGRTPWIKPYTDVVLEDLAKKGIKRLAVACPSFVADCLETIEEIGIRAKEDWIRFGGEELKLIPCLNHRSDWIDSCVKLIKDRNI